MHFETVIGLEVHMLKTDSKCSPSPAHLELNQIQIQMLST